jgi:hypothetical protein
MGLGQASLISSEHRLSAVPLEFRSAKTNLAWKLPWGKTRELPPDRRNQGGLPPFDLTFTCDDGGKGRSQFASFDDSALHDCQEPRAVFEQPDVGQHVAFDD